MKPFAIVIFSFIVSYVAGAEEMKMEKIEYGGWPNCIRLSNGNIELVATTDVGPRIMRLGFVGGENLFKEYDDELGKTGGDEWRIYGGHRLWHAPEEKPRTYAPDNSPIEFEWNDSSLLLHQPVEESTGIEKEIEIQLNGENGVRAAHRLTNTNYWSVELAPWCLSVMAPGGRAIIPQEPYISHAEKVLPARPLVLWHYTDMSDPRWIWGKKYIQLKHDSGSEGPQKIGVMNSLGWAAYVLGDQVFLKCYESDPDADYPDFGCNTETFTNKDMLELETVGPLVDLGPGETVEWVEHWLLFQAKVGADEDSIDKVLLPLVQKSDVF